MNDLNIKEELLAKIIRLSQNLWDKKVTRGDIENWLENFESSEKQDECEQVHALYVLSNFLYFGNKEIRALLKSVYRSKFEIPLKNKIRKDNNGTTNRSIICDILNQEISKTRFLGVGNPSESGTHLLYYFRQESQLPRANFINAHDIFSVEIDDSGEEKQRLSDPGVERYVFIDDLCGSGSQAIQYSKSIVERIKRMLPNVEVYYIPLFSTSVGIENVRANTSFDQVDAIFYLDDSFKIFSEDSRYFKSSPAEISKDFAHEVFYKYGQSICPQHPLGYEDGQQIIGFEHNIPDNTLPAIWFESESSNWIPIFKRYHKIG